MQQLYAISDETLTPYSTIHSQLQTALRAGVSIFQLRDKTHTDSEIASLSSELAALCHQHNARFVLNDRYELALRLNVGVHLGKDEIHKLDPSESATLPYLGISCYDSLENAKRAKALGADYVAFGSCFDSPTKPAAVRAPLALFEQALPLGIPLCAIGGITPKNAKFLKNADILAVITALWRGDIAQNVAQFLEAMRAN